MKYMLNAYITVCECINILAIYNVITQGLGASEKEKKNKTI